MKTMVLSKFFNVRLFDYRDSVLYTVVSKIVNTLHLYNKREEHMLHLLELFWEY